MTNDINLRTQQALIEYQYSKHTIKEIIMKEIQTDLGDVIEKGAELIRTYVASDFYPGKRARIDVIKDMDYVELVTKTICCSITIETIEPIQRLVTAVANHLPYECPLESARTAAELVIVLAELDIYDVLLASDSETGSMQIVSNILLDDVTRGEIIGKKYLPPMLCRPNEVDSNITSSHLTTGDESLILGKGNHHYEGLAYDAINITNNVELELNYDIIDNCIELPKHPEQKAGETRREHRERIEHHNYMVIESKKVYEQLRGESFFLTSKYCKRGRTHVSGYHVTNQGNEFKKASIVLRKKHLITGV